MVQGEGLEARSFSDGVVSLAGRVVIADAAAAGQRFGEVVGREGGFGAVAEAVFNVVVRGIGGDVVDPGADCSVATES